MLISALSTVHTMLQLLWQPLPCVSTRQLMAHRLLPADLIRAGDTPAAERGMQAAGSTPQCSTAARGGTEAAAAERTAAVAVRDTAAAG
jgi:hypothetical protein